MYLAEYLAQYLAQYFAQCIVLKPDCNVAVIQLAVETVFLEAASQLVTPGSSGLSARQAEALERLAFDWALNAETYVEPKYGELTRYRERVCLQKSIAQ